MATRLLPPGSYVLDAAGFVSLQAVRSAAAHPNCDGLSLYDGGRYGCTIEHVKIVHDSGKCVGPNWERRADEAMYGAGAWAVQSARAGVEKWGIDPSLVPTILSGVDFSTTTAQWAQLDFWHETACDEADATNTWIGFYGETKYGNHLIAQPWWQRTGNRPTWTWGGSGMIAGTNMKQHVGFPSGIAWNLPVIVDESRVEDGLVMSAADGDPPVPPGGTDMPTVLTVPGVVTLISPSPPDGPHSHASWVDTDGERAYLLQFLPEQILTAEQCGGIRIVGDMRADLAPMFRRVYRGDTGATGAKGDQGVKGDQGPKGDAGAKGDKGDPGNPGVVAGHHHVQSSGPAVSD